MRIRPYTVFFLGPVVAYLVVLLLIAVFVVEPTTLGWIGFGVAAAVGLLIGGAATFLYPRSRTNALRLRPQTDGTLRLLIVADTRCEGTTLCEAAQRALAGRTGEVLVVAPVLASPLHFLTDAEDAESEDARVRLTEALQALTRLGIPAQGTLGSDDPLEAIGDALTGFPANEILLAAPEQGRRSWLERDLEHKARHVYGVHVSTVTLETASPAPAP
ncbi:MAG TPA: hypothetical protein VLV28_07875 [Gaiellaceae bacterium]|nr:hypothetical protein [Gaiellaceae bacterium]